MAIKIQGSTIIDDSKNIQDNTGFFSDAINSALRPKSSSGGSYLQRWTGSTWETILEARDGGIFCNRSISVNSPYKYYGDGSSLTGISASNSDTVDSFHASEGFFNNSWCSRIPVVASNGVLEIGKFIDFHNNCGSNVDYTYRLDNYSDGNLGFSGSVLVTSNATVSGSVSVTGQATISGNAIIGESSAITMGYGGHSFIEVRRGSYPYIDFGAESYSDYAGRVAATSGGELVLDPRVNLQITNVPEGAVTADPNLKITAGGRIRRLTSTRRIKENIQYSDFDHISDKIYDLKTAYFTYTEAEDSSALDMGLIAEDVNELIPELAIIDYFRDQYEEVIVPERGNSIEKKLKENAVKTPVSVNYDRLPIIMIGTLKKLRQRVIDLEEEMQSLKASLQTP